MITHAPLQVGLQKRSGHMFGMSRDLLAQNWRIQIPADLGKGSKETVETVACFKPSIERGILINLLTCRIEDIVTDVSEGDLDMGVVSSDILPRAALAASELFEHQTGIVVKDIGSAGSRPMIGVAQSLIEGYPLWPKEYLWRFGVTRSSELSLPIFTSLAPQDLRQFLEQESLPVPRIAQRRGTVEARARMNQTLIIADLVSSGQSMANHNCVPVCSIGPESRMLLIARMREKGSSRHKALITLMNAIPGKPPRLINIGTAPV